MITQLVMIFTVVFLAWTGYQFLKRAKKVNFPSGKTFAYGLFFIALGILFYAIRDIFIQVKLYDIQALFLLIGALFHLFGGYLILWFLTKEFGPRSYFKYVFYFLFGVSLMSFAFFMSGKLFKLESELQQAPLEPFSYFVIRNYLSDPTGIFILYGAIGLISALILGVVIVNFFKLKEKKLKGLLYGGGVWFLITPMIICAVLSPVYARIGYLIGAILVYQAFKTKV